MNRKPKDRDFIETKEGLFFCVVDYIHPTDKYTAYLKYIPSDKGKWQDNNKHYWRVLDFYHVLNVEKTFNYLKENFPHYITYDKYRHIEMSMIPKEYVKQYYIPEVRFENIMKQPANILESDAVKIAEQIKSVTDTKLIFGITGSILIGIANEKFSDVDLTIYGLRESHKVKNALIEIKAQNEAIVTDMSPKHKKRWIKDKQKQFGISKALLEYLANKKWNYGMLEGRRYFSIHPIRKDDEIKEKYGDKEFIDMGHIIVKATVYNDEEAIFLPAIYKIDDVNVIKGTKVSDIREIVSFEGLYGDVTTPDMKIIASGKLEKVISADETYYRIVLGAGGLDQPQYMGPAELIKV